MNTIFIVGLLWFLNQQERQRVDLYGPIVTSCVRGMAGK